MPFQNFQLISSINSVYFFYISCIFIFNLPHYLQSWVRKYASVCSSPENKVVQSEFFMLHYLKIFTYLLSIKF